ncbi:MAG: DeoR/GlpR transcriptional regulator [Clostridia bacterium]|nr:DeoR/GlpR transcriptional regulator [Clostridia bacterium]NCC76425.1 DeoR/GlpR transcriptional regulator [Clostridia bacterium]
MFAAERLRIIRSYVLEKKKASVAEISRMLGVSEVTIRRDLEALDEEGFLIRTHGGAILSGEDNLEALPTGGEADAEREQRSEISEIAIYLINDGDTLLLSPGKTNLAIARRLQRKKNLVVLTNDLLIASELASHPSARVIVPGGDLDSLTLSLNGPLTIHGLRQYYVAKAFIEVDGIHLQRGFTIKYPIQLEVFQEMMQMSQERIFVGTPSVFNQISFSQVGPLSSATAVVTHPAVPDEYKRQLFESNITLYASFTAYNQIGRAGDLR